MIDCQMRLYFSASSRARLILSSVQFRATILGFRVILSKVEVAHALPDQRYVDGDIGAHEKRYVERGRYHLDY